VVTRGTDKKKGNSIYIYSSSRGGAPSAGGSPCFFSRVARPALVSSGRETGAAFWVWTPGTVGNAPKDEFGSGAFGGKGLEALRPARAGPVAIAAGARHPQGPGQNVGGFGGGRVRLVYDVAWRSGHGSWPHRQLPATAVVEDVGDFDRGALRTMTSDGVAVTESVGRRFIAPMCSWRPSGRDADEGLGPPGRRR